MKVMNIVLLSYALAFLSVLGLCMGAEHLFGENAIYVVLVPGILMAASSRRIVEKFLGYAIEDALKEDRNESK
jgi:hypothetical protein